MEQKQKTKTKKAIEKTVRFNYGNQLAADVQKTSHRQSGYGKGKELNTRSDEETAQNKEAFFYDRDTDEMIVGDVLKDFEARRAERRAFDLTWELNMNFVLGNQYSSISPSGEITDTEKSFFWECREVYNHIAPIVETRLAKLAKVRPIPNVLPTSSEQSDVYCAKLSKAILDYSRNRLNIPALISEATVWSEVTGTAFYKVAWNSSKGEVLALDDGKSILAGDVEISVCPPFEIYPDSCGSSSLEACNSIIHARIMPSCEVESKFGVVVAGKDYDAFGLDANSFMSGFSGRSNVTKLVSHIKHNHVLVIEKYCKPDADNPKGKLTIVVGDKLIFDGELPFILGENDERGFPFIRQISCSQVGTFWGASVVERCIPIQRAYNAIKNRKHEFLARLAGGVLAVEDGSVDIDNLENEGLAPGKILVYRAGSSIPKFMDAGDVPYDFNREEDRLLDEFTTVSGVSEFMRDSAVPSTISSGTALSMLIEQDETRLSVTAEYIREATRKMADMLIKLYKQFASNKRLCQVSDENGEIEIFYWTGSDLTSCDIVLDTVNELTETPAQRKNLMLDLFKMGLFHDENGRLSNRVRYKLLDGLGFGLWDFAQDERSLQTKRAIKENLNMTKDTIPSEIDDHKIHIEEHKKYLLTDECDERGKDYRDLIMAHIVAHKNMSISDDAFNALNKN